MLLHKQKFGHDPENGVWGDCGRTVLACMLDLEVEEVPHFGEGGPSDEEYMNRMREWLRQRDLGIAEFVYNGKDLTIDALLQHVEEQNPGLIFSLIGTSKNEVCHVVICSGGKIIHDPAVDNSGVVGPHKGHYIVEVLVPSFHLRDEGDTLSKGEK